MLESQNLQIVWDWFHPSSGIFILFISDIPIWIKTSWSQAAASCFDVILPGLLIQSIAYWIFLGKTLELTKARSYQLPPEHRDLSWSFWMPFGRGRVDTERHIFGSAVPPSSPTGMRDVREVWRSRPIPVVFRWFCDLPKSLEIQFGAFWRWEGEGVQIV